MTVSDKTVMEEMGLSKEDYYNLYDENKGFNNQFNRNKPGHLPEETFYDFLGKGAKRLIEENKELVQSLSEE